MESAEQAAGVGRGVGCVHEKEESYRSCASLKGHCCSAFALALQTLANGFPLAASALLQSHSSFLEAPSQGREEGASIAHAPLSRAVEGDPSAAAGLAPDVGRRPTRKAGAGWGRESPHRCPSGS